MAPQERSTNIDTGRTKTKDGKGTGSNESLDTMTLRVSHTDGGTVNIEDLPTADIDKNRTITSPPSPHTTDSSPPSPHTTDSNEPRSCGSFKLSCVSFNCKAFKSGSDYLAKLLSENDILCLTETWLRPGELVGIKPWLQNHPLLCNSEYKIFAKSAMDDTANYNGRPYGGVCIIARKSDQLLFREIESPNPRIIQAGVHNIKGDLLQVICNVYMPYCDGSKNIESLVDTIDELQITIDQYSARCPVKLLGDFNCNVPRDAPDCSKWYKNRGYNSHSLIVYNFMVANNLVAIDRSFTQSIDYTYFCDKREVFSWLDHVMCFHYDMYSVTECIVVNREPDNDSDHLPIRFVFHVKDASDTLFKANMSADRKGNSVYVSWKCANAQARYKSALEAKLYNMKSLTINVSDSSEAVQCEVDRFTEDFTKAVHDATKESGCSPNKHFQPKPYWCPELSYMRDRKRFWWKIWTDNGRPKKGAVYECYKGIKKMFRRLSRKCMDNLLAQNFSKFNDLYCNRKLSAFWKTLKNSRRCKANSTLKPESLARYYCNIMTDTGPFTPEQVARAKTVEKWYKDLAMSGYQKYFVSPETICDFITKLNSNCAPGLDGLTSEHLKYGKSNILCSVLSDLFSCLLSWNIVPSVFQVGVIVPILKKPTLNPNEESNYRPVTLSSVLSKLLEMLLLPEDNVCKNQFGFRKGRGTAFACTMVNDVKEYFRKTSSPLFVCSLDAEKCFDSICHVSLFMKLRAKIPDKHWILLYRWYKNLKAIVKWKNGFSNSFNVTRGTRQGSLLSPQLFNIFIDDLLIELDESPDRVRIGNCCLNSFAYADDITLLCTTIPGLQRLIDICCSYASKWRFKFGISKTKCMVVSGDCFVQQPRWFLNNLAIDNVDNLEILGVHFDSNNAQHVNVRSEKCRKSFYSLRDAGMAFPGCHTDVKTYLWKTMCQPVLLYGCETIHLSTSDVQKLETLQGNLLKQSIGLSHRSKSSSLMRALNITSVKDKIKLNSASLLRRIYAVDSPVRDLTNHFLSLYICKGLLYPGTLVHRIVSFGLSPIDCIFNKQYLPPKPPCGIVDSLQMLLMHNHFLKPYSDEHVLSSLLTRAFKCMMWRVLFLYFMYFSIFGGFNE